MTKHNPIIVPEPKTRPKKPKPSRENDPWKLPEEIPFPKIKPKAFVFY